MYYQLSRTGLTEIRKKNINSQFAGSSSLKAWNNQVFKKEKNNKKTIIEKLEESAQQTEIKEKEIKNYKLKKSKIRNKILNFFSLDASKKFCAFYTITFTLSIDDNLAYQLFNIWLTRCRKSEGLHSYLWVAERQKNGTLHFHLITNTYMRIRIVNAFMRESLQTQFDKGNLNCSQKIINNYNGIDVDNLYQPKKRKDNKKRLSGNEAKDKLSFYLTKYVTKNDTLSNRLPWHCSRDISALFISINYSDISNHEIASLISDNPDAVLSFHDEYISFHYFLFRPDESYFNDLVSINNMIYDTFNSN